MSGCSVPTSPSSRIPNYYTVILTGGSVASQLGQNQKPPAPRYLEEELNKKYVSPNGKPWLVLNGADGAWKEPQPFILFSLYASSVDAVVSLGGYNEHYFFWPDAEERLERPLSNFIEVNPFAADENFGDAAIGWVMGRVAGTLALNPVLGHSHAAYMIIRGIEAGRQGPGCLQVDARRRRSTASSTCPWKCARTPSVAFNIQLGLYQKYLRATEAVAHDNNVKIGLLPPAGAGLWQDVDRGREARCRRSGLPRSLPQDRGRHDDAARARPADLRPRRYLRRTRRARSTPTISIIPRRQPAKAAAIA